MIPKFRAWVKPGVLSNHLDGVIAEAKPDFLGMNCLVKRNDLVGKDCFTEIVDFDDVILMQSTGLKDKNGVEIYAGDIVQSTWYDVDNNPYKKKGEITYAGAQYVIAYDSQFDVETGEITYDAHSLSYAENPEVIGNIYTNPELLS